VTGALIAWLGGTAAYGAAGVVVPSPPPAWTNIFGSDYGATNSQTISGITTPITVSLANSGSGALLYILNGYQTPYTGSFTVHAGDILAFGIAVGNAVQSGAITVTNVSNGSATLATIGYVVRSSGGGGGRGILP
jgi:hypothetical protein